MSKSSNAFHPRRPRFKQGHRVVVTLPGVYHDRQGIVIEVVKPSAGSVYRYRVRFADGAEETFFGFELGGDPEGHSQNQEGQNPSTG